MISSDVRLLARNILVTKKLSDHEAFKFHQDYIVAFRQCRKCLQGKNTKKDDATKCSNYVRWTIFMIEHNCLQEKG